MTALRLELLIPQLKGKRPVRVIVIDTFRCGHARAYNTWVDANGQSRCKICNRRKK
jgi:hypothetical protein